MSVVPECTRRQLIDFMVDLTREQNSVGSWVTAQATLQSTVVTCQAMLFVAGFRGPLSAKSLSRAAAWFQRPDVKGTEFTYWRALPLIEAGSDEPSIAEAIDHVRRNVGTIVHHRNSPLEAFCVDCLIVRNLPLDDKAKALIAKWAAMLSAKDIAVSPEHLAYILYVYSGSQMNVKTDEVLEGLGFLEQQSSFDGVSSRSWHSLVATSYIVLSLLRLYHVSNDAHIRQKAELLAREATVGLVREWAKGQLDSEPLAGGDFRNTPYNKIVVARAIGALAEHEDRGWREDYWVERYATEKASKRTLVYMLVGAGLVLTGQCILPWVSKALESTSQHWNSASRVADFLGIGTLILRGGQLLYARLGARKR